MTSIGPNRSKRQRKSVCHYSDDNPNTFTVKVKKGDLELGNNGTNTLQVDGNSIASRRGQKRPRTSPRSKHAINFNQRQQQGQYGDGDEDDDNVIIASLAASTPSTRARRGRPPRRSSTCSTSSDSSNRSSSPVGTISSTAPRTKMTTKVSIQQKTEGDAIAPPIRRPRRVRILTSTSSIPQDEIISHTAAIHSVLPLDEMMLQQSPKLYEFFNDARPQPAQPEWIHLNIEDDILLRCPLTGTQVATRQSQIISSRAKNTTSSSQLLDAAATTVAPAIAITAFCCRQQPLEIPISTEKQWIIIGDCTGGVSLWKVGCPRPLCTLKTAASRREELRVVLSRKVISYPNSVQGVAWSSTDVVLVLTETDLEGIQVISPHSQRTDAAQLEWQSRRFLVNVSQSPTRDLPLSQQFHFHYRDPLVLWSTDGREIEGSQQINAAEASPGTGNTLQCLDMLTATINSVKCISLQPEIGAHFRCMVSIWDAYLLTQTEGIDSILVVAQTSSDLLALLRLKYNRMSESTVVMDRYSIPLMVGRSMNVSQMDFTIQQIPTLGYKFTMLTGYRTAIHLLDSRTLSCVATFGRSISLHGKSVQWKTCFWIRSPPERKSGELGIIRGGGGKLKHYWWETPDELAARAVRSSQCSQKPFSTSDRRHDDYRKYLASTVSSSSVATNSDHSFWLIGIPHPSKGPTELNSTLYIWKNPLIGISNNDDDCFDSFAQQERLQIQQHVDTSIKLPHGGCLGLSIVTRRHDLEMLCVTASTGQLYEKKPSLQTDFAGVMYPIGYKVIEDNLEYYEDEDEMDQPIILEELKDCPVMAPVKPKQRGRPKKNQTPSPRAADFDPDTALQTSTFKPQNQYSAPAAFSADDQEETVEVTGLLNQMLEDDDTAFIVPCWPACHHSPEAKTDPYKDSSDENDASDNIANSPNRLRREKFQVNYLSSFPQFHSTQLTFKQQSLTTTRNALHHHDSSNASSSGEACDEIQAFPSSSATSFVNISFQSSTCTMMKACIKGSKRSRSATVEGVLQSSIGPELKMMMSVERGRWAKGSFSLMHEQLLTLQSNIDNSLNCGLPLSDEERTASSTPEVISVEDCVNASIDSSTCKNEALSPLKETESSNGKPHTPVLSNRLSPENKFINISYQQARSVDTGRNESYQHLSTEFSSLAKTTHNQKHVASKTCALSDSLLESSATVGSMANIIRNGDENATGSLFLNTELQDSVVSATLHNVTETAVVLESISDVTKTTMDAINGDDSLAQLRHNNNLPTSISGKAGLNFFPVRSPSSEKEDDEVKAVVESHANLSNHAKRENENGKIAVEDISFSPNSESRFGEQLPSSSLITSIAKAECGSINFVVTPSEVSPAHIVHGELTVKGANLTKPFKSHSNCSSKPYCAACRGRMIVHTCGKREKPVDYDAIALAERERQERLAADKALAKANKRRDADARRREAKRLKKKEEEDRIKNIEQEAMLLELESRRRQEEERLEMEEHERRLRLDNEKRIRDEIARKRELEGHGLQDSLRAQFDDVQVCVETEGGLESRVDSVQHNFSAQRNSVRTDSLLYGNESFSYPKRVPSYHTINQMSGKAFATESFGNSNGNHFYQPGTLQVRNGMVDSWRVERANKNYLVDSRCATITIGGNAVQTSASLDPSDALAALAGLADSIHNAERNDKYIEPTNTALIDHESAGLSSYVDQVGNYSYRQATGQGFPYEYSGPLERQAAIHRALADCSLTEGMDGYAGSLNTTDTTRPTDHHNEQSHCSVIAAKYSDFDGGELEAAQETNHDVSSVSHSPFRHISARDVSYRRNLPEYDDHSGKTAHLEEQR